MKVLSAETPEFAAPPGRRLVVFGDPVGHSLSPAMHNAALAEMSTRHPHLASWRYEAVHVSAEALPGALRRMHAAEVVGINLTIPHKVAAMAHVEDIEEEARRMGAINTLIRTDTGYKATNTDGFGIRKAIENAFGISLEGRDVWLFGAGGAARGILVSCLEGNCRRLTVINRSAERLDDLSRQAGGLPGRDRLRFLPLAEAPLDVDEGAVLINATSLGLKAEDPCPVPEAFLRPKGYVYDTTYGVRNALAIHCHEHALNYADGLPMLVWQGVKSLEIWTGLPVPAETMMAAARSALKEREG